MRAAVIAQPGVAELRQVDIPTLGERDVLVRVEGCGVCGSNVPVWEGRDWFQYPLQPGAPGHEGWGRIAALGAQAQSRTGNRTGDSLAVGDRVAMMSYTAFAEYEVASADAVVKVPPGLDDQPFPGEPLACAMNVFARAQIEPGQTVAIVGAGFLGANLVALAAQAGARVIAISRRRFALEIAEALGAAHTIPMEDHWQIVEQVKQLTSGNGCECVIEAVGLQWPLDLAAELTAVRGRLVIAGYHQDGPRQVNMQLWNWRGLDVINAHERDPAVYVKGLAAAVDAVTSGALHPSALYTHTFPLEELGAALEMLRQRPDGFLKALVVTG